MKAEGKFPYLAGRTEDSHWREWEWGGRGAVGDGGNAINNDSLGLFFICITFFSGVVAR